MLIDMPLAKLKRYRGRNPKPADFERYWERALKEMRAVDPQVKLVKSRFQTPGAECFDLYFTGVRQARIHAKYIRPRQGKKPHPAVLQFHGYSGSSGDWCDKLNYIAQGFSVAALDCRGQGGQSQDIGNVKGNTHRGHIIRGLDDGPEQLLFRHIFLDTAQLARIVMGLPEVDEHRVGA
ncbi:MAG: acetylxylan esterase, partial [Lentisphaerae bacterium]|nr:acetylxylan esterase [Lentisphaerota bacterium]